MIPIYLLGIVEYFKECPKDDVIKAELKGILWATKEEKKTIDSYKIDRIWDVCVPQLDKRRRKLKEIIKAIEEVLQ